MPRYIGDNLKGSELIRHRNKCVSIFMLGSVILGGFLFKYGAPTFRKDLLEGKYEDTQEWKDKKLYMQFQINPKHRQIVENAQAIMDQNRTSDVPSKRMR